MKLNQLRVPRGSRKRPKRVGRGRSSGHGKTSTRGHKGQKARSGGGVRPGFEGGQMPLSRRLPKRGFANIFRKEYTILNVGDLEQRFKAGDEITPEVLKEQGLMGKRERIKILGEGRLTKGLKVRAHAFSREAEKKIKEAGGEVIRC
ncbi:MAG TPA: 50S ribosomal protein L15 [bacterium]|nr:50S ribosomal protein L15 [bacterium]